MVSPWPPFPARSPLKWVAIGEFCPRSCSSYAGQCRLCVGMGPRHPRSCSSYAGWRFALHALRHLYATGLSYPAELQLLRGAASRLSCVTALPPITLLHFRAVFVGTGPKLPGGAAALTRGSVLPFVRYCVMLYVTVYLLPVFSQKGGAPCGELAPAGGLLV